MTPNAVVIMLLLLFLSTFLIVLGSMGDQDPRYYHCFILCSDTCPEAFTSETRSFYYIYPDWNCEDDCRYSCMHEITSLRLKNGYGVLKYYGHWPFHRCFGFEEFASVIFSLANSIPHILQLLGMLGVKSPTFMSSWLLMYPIFAVNAWSFSAIFHARKTEYTTLLDYISALLFLAYNLWIALRRAWGSSADPTIVSTVFIIDCFLLGYQCHEMIMGRVDYGSHMTVCISVSVLQASTCCASCCSLLDPVYQLSLHGKQSCR